MIYPNKQAAEEALNQIEKELPTFLGEFLKERGASIFIDYEDSDIEIGVRYINEKGHEDYSTRTLDL